MADPITAYFQPTPEAQWLELEFIAADQLGLPTTNWGTFSPERNILTINARMLEVLNVACIERYRGMFLSYAEGDPLTILAEETYQTPRLPATFATCIGEFFNSTITVYNIPAGDYITLKKSTTDDIRYRVDGPIAIAPGLTAGLTVRAVTAGSVGSAIVGEIDEIEGNALAGVTFTNTSIATARDEESDDDLRSRARLAATALSIAGPAGAYEYFAKGGERNGEIDEGVAAIGVTRVSVVGDTATGSVKAYYATASGPVSGPDLATINAKILLRVVPVGIDYQGFSATAVAVDVDYKAYVREDLGIDETALKAAIAADLATFMQAAPIGGYPEAIATPGKTGSIDLKRVLGVIGDVELDEEEPVHNVVATVNLGGAVLFNQNEVPVLGAVTANVIYQGPQAP